MRRRVFAGSSREAISVCRFLQAELDDQFDVKVWDQDVFALTHSGLESLLNELESSDAGLFVLAPDDIVLSRDRIQHETRDNVIFELGMFMGSLGRDRTFVVAPQGIDLRIPSDLAGITVAEYDGGRPDQRAAIGPACTRIREHLEKTRFEPVVEPESRKRLDRAMARMSRDLEALFEDPRPNADVWVTGSRPDEVSLRVGRASVRLRFGGIEEVLTEDEASVVALPANEYFNDECISDGRSALGAYVQRSFEVGQFVALVAAELVGLPCQRVPRSEKRVEDSFGIGQTVLISNLSPQRRVMLVSATTERVGVGLRAEPHFLYAAAQGVFERMNQDRLTKLSMPVFGAGHGGVPLRVALLFNLLALRSLLRDDIGRHIRSIDIFVLPSEASASPNVLQQVVERLIGTP